MVSYDSDTVDSCSRGVHDGIGLRGGASRYGENDLIEDMERSVWFDHSSSLKRHIFIHNSSYIEQRQSSGLRSLDLTLAEYLSKDGKVWKLWTYSRILHYSLSDIRYPYL